MKVEQIVNQVLLLSFRLELLGLTLLCWLGIYFFVNRLQVEPNRRLDMGTAFDRKIPFVPQMALIYFSTYIFVVQPFFILSDARQFYWMLASFASISIIASLVHAIVPSQIQRMEEPSSAGISGKLLSLFQRTCKPYGNFPSMHVALSVPVVVANYMVFGSVMGSISLVWGLLIALSTLFTKQHYIMDVLAGLLGGTVVFLLAYWFIMV
jgi:membrane-associated phospholipid phosphatase